MNIVGIIPSRYASQRLPAKSLASIHGKPMIQHVYERACRSKLLTDVLVATDDERIEQAVRKFGGKAVMTPGSIQSGSDRAAYAARSIDAEIIVNIQGDEPLIEPRMIDQAVQLLIDDPEVVVGTAARRISTAVEIFNPNVVKVVVDRYMNALYFSRSPIPNVRVAMKNAEWADSAVFYKHFGIYVYRKSFLEKFSTLQPTPLESAEKLEQLRILENGYHIKVAVTEYDSVAVDTPDDLENVRTLMKNQ